MELEAKSFCKSVDFATSFADITKADELTACFELAMAEITVHPDFLFCHYVQFFAIVGLVDSHD